MTSSSDSEISSFRKIFIHGLSKGIRQTELRGFLQEFGAVTSMRLTKKGYGFVIFDEESGANAALGANGREFMGNTLSIELAHNQGPNLTTRREILFPRPFGGRGPRFSSSLLLNRYPNRVRNNPRCSGGASAALPSNQPTTSVVSSSSRNPKSRHDRNKAHNSSKSSAAVNRIHVIHEARPDCGDIEPEQVERRRSLERVTDEIKSLFSFNQFPHIAKNIFNHLDTVSLQRCLLVCRDWHRDILSHVLRTTPTQQAFQNRWRTGECSIYTVTPDNNEDRLDNNAHCYRNVLSVKADELEIMLAIDNGNIEIYDRYSLNRKCVIAGHMSSSPAFLDFNDKIIFVNYTSGFLRLGRKMSSCWNIYERQTKVLLNSIERDTVDDVIIGYDDHLYLSTKNMIFAIYNYTIPDYVKMKKVYVVPETDVIEDLEVDNGFVVAAVKRDADLNKKLALHVWQRPQPDGFLDEPEPDFMTRLEHMFPILDQDFCDTLESFNEKKCNIMSIQVRWPLCLVHISTNRRGNYEHYYENHPYNFIVLCDLLQERANRILTLSDLWMQTHDQLVPYDSDTTVVKARFSADHLVIGFGSCSAVADGGIGIWSMSELLDPAVAENDLTMTSLPGPIYHWATHDRHEGGVNCIHVDRFGIVATNACFHQVATRCIEKMNEAKKDNVLVYDFWKPGIDTRRNLHLNYLNVVRTAQ